jgi:hypothetical protein
MILGTLLLSLAVGSACGVTAFCCGFGVIQSLVIYVVSGQLMFIIVPLVTVLLQPIFRDMLGHFGGEDRSLDGGWQQP